MRPRTARALVWLLALLPVVLFALALGGRDLASPALFLNAAGRLSGIAGLALLLLAAALSARVPGFDQPFGGLTKLWQTHHQLGAWSLILVLAHPLLLALSAGAGGVGAAAATLVPPLSDLASWSGWLALLLMMVFLAPSFSFFGPPRYERWKRIHRLAGPAVVLALLHNFWLARSLPFWLDVVIWGALAALAVGAVVWRFVFSRRMGRLEYRVSGAVPVTNNVVELTLQPRGRPLRYQAGNFVYLTVYDRTLAAGHGEEHPYTLCSAPKEPDLRIAIKALGDASRAIQSIEPGSRATVEGPYGRFFNNPDRVETPELWIAGGIGIAPFLGRMRHLQQQRQPADVCLICCVQDEARAIYRDEINALADALPGFHLRMHYFYREGPVSMQYLESACADFRSREIYICGPTPLNNLIRKHAAHAGIPSLRIQSEEFELL